MIPYDTVALTVLFAWIAFCIIVFLGGIRREKPWVDPEKKRESHE